MPPRYRIILEKASPNPRENQAIELLQKFSRADAKEIKFWLQNLPHTVTAQASENTANTLVEEFTALGYTVRCLPTIPSLKPISPTAEKTKQDFSIGHNPKKGTYKKSFYPTLTILALIILMFGGSLYIALSLVQKVTSPTMEDVKDFISKGKHKLVKNILSQKLSSQGGTALEFKSLAIARIQKINQTGMENNWRRHLTSRSWDEDLTRLQNYYKTSEGDSALAELQRAIELNPDDIEAYQWLGILHQQRQEYLEAQMAFANCLRLDPDNIMYLNYLATSQIDLNKLKEAEASFTKALTLQPNNPMTLKNMGAFEMYVRKDTSAGLRHYIKYLKKESGFDFERPVIRGEVTQILWDKYFPTTPKQNQNPSPKSFNQFEKRRKLIEAKLDLKKDSQLYLELGNLFDKRGLIKEAQLYWKLALKENRKNLEASENLIWSQGRLGQFNELKGSLKNAIHHHPEINKYQFALGLIEKYYGENKKNAIKSFKTYLKSPEAAFSQQAQVELDELLMN